jgi:hypothetical protein
MHELEVLRRLHEGLRPEAYLQIGVGEGEALALARTRTVAVDPAPAPRPEALLGKPLLLLAVETADGFFARYERDALLGGARLDLAVIAGWPTVAQAVRDLAHVERWSHPGTVVVILGAQPGDGRAGDADGVVWPVGVFLREHRPDLRCWLTAAEPAGLLIVTRLDPSHPGLGAAADVLDREASTERGEGERMATAPAARPAADVLRLLGCGERPEDPWQYDTKWGMRLVAERSWRPLLQLAADGGEGEWSELGAAACYRLIGAYWLPAGVREEAYRHLARYAAPLATLWPGAACRRVALPTGAPARAGPGLAVRDDRLLATVLTAGGDDEPAWRLLGLGDDLALHTATPLRDATRDDPSPPVPFERVQSIWHEGALRAVVTATDRNPRGVAQTGLVEIEDGAMRGYRLLSDPALGRDERGWAPFVADGGLHVVSAWEPTEVRRVDVATGETHRVAQHLAPRLAERFAGASAGVAIPAGWLFLVNEATPAAAEMPEQLFARFVLLDAAYSIAAVSPHFWVAARGRDEAGGLARQGDRLHAGFRAEGGVVLVTLDLAAVVASLIPIASLAAASAHGDARAGSPVLEEAMTGRARGTS